VYSRTAADRAAAPRMRSALVLVAILASASVARAQSAPLPHATTASPQDAALAQSLFDEGRRGMIAGTFADACPKLAESERLDPALGTLLNLAVCNERLGRTASAWAEYRDAESMAKREGRAEREAYARDRAAAIEPRLSRLLIARANGNADRGLEVRIDGEAVGEAVLGTAVPVDPGTHHIDVHAAGKKSWSATVTVGASGERQSVDVPALEDAPEAPPPVGVVQSAGGPLAIQLPSAPPPEEPQVARGDRGPSRTLIVTAGAIGLAALVVGGVAGTQALVKWTDRRALCVGDTCSPAGIEADSAAKRWAVVSDVGVGIGVVALAAAGTMFAVSRAQRDRSAAVRVVPVASARGGGLAIDGAW
jgi:hypothetical protein